MAAPGVFAKLQLKDQPAIVVLDAPESFEPELRALNDVRVLRSFPAKPASFALAFMTTPAQLAGYARELKRHVSGDAVVWVAYPKGSSKRYRSTLHRDTGWKPLGALGYEPVRMVAIDEDWSAVRFRKAEFIRSMKRGAEHAISKAGQARAKEAR
jgi:hypothetical protein